MRKKLLITLLPLLGAVVMVGSAYSAWVFSNSAALEQKLNGTVTVTDLVETMEFEWTGGVTSFTLTLDQGGVNNTDVATGISSSLDNDDDAFTFTLTKDANINLSLYDITLEYSLSITSGGDYITLANGTEGVITDSNIVLAEKGATEENLTYTYSENVFTFTLDATGSDGKVFHYLENQKPTSAVSYNSMSSYYANPTNAVELTFDASITISDHHVGA